MKKPITMIRMIRFCLEEGSHNKRMNNFDGLLSTKVMSQAGIKSTFSKSGG